MQRQPFLGLGHGAAESDSEKHYKKAMLFAGFEESRGGRSAPGSYLLGGHSPAAAATLPL
jgi:hypothetical protein